MQRFNHTRTGHKGNFGQFYEPVPIARFAIAPGTSMHAVGGKLRISTETLTRYVLNDALVQIFAFYVPYRLLWDQWVDFIGGDDTLSIPTNATPYSLMFETTNANVFGRRAYKLIYNEFFGNKAVGAAAWFDDITDDADMNPRVSRIWDQYFSKFTIDDPTNVTYTAPIPGGDPLNGAQIDLAQFAREMRNARSLQRQQLTGNKYVDTMRAMGVDLDWRIQNAPEFLGKASKVIGPITVESTDPNDLSARQVRYESSVTYKFNKRRAFAEHGEVIVLATVRPSMIASNGSALPSGQFNREDFFLGDNLAVWDQSVSTFNIERLFPYLYENDGEGRTTTAANGRPWLTNDAGSVANNLYPDPSQILTDGEYGGFQIAMFHDVKMNDTSPVPKGRV